jgi:hypothetical protein
MLKYFVIPTQESIEENAKKNYSQKRSANEYLGFFICAPIIQIIVSLASVISALSYINFVIISNANLLQSITFFSLFVLLVLEISKNYFLSKMTLKFFKDFKSLEFLILFLVAGILIYFSVFTSLNGVNKYFEQSKHELVHFSENLESKEKKKIDSLVSFFDSQILTKKNENEFVNENLKNKLIVLKNDTDTTDLWSPKSKTNQGFE